MDTEEIGIDEGLDLGQSWETPCEFTSGVAGSGKTFSVREKQRVDPKYAVLAASTGISAVNLGTTTINSLLGYFDHTSLVDGYLSGSVGRKLRELMKEGYARVAIDEVSMIGGDTLDVLVRAFDSVNQEPPKEARGPLGLALVGDFAQLPPVKASWAFEAANWDRFEAHTTRLTKVWRQADVRFLNALNHARGGDGQGCAGMLRELGARFETALDTGFDGTTIVPKNDQVDRFNQIALDRVKGPRFSVTSRRWGQQRGEWKQIPERMELREGAYVMLLANKLEDGELVYANGDCGHIASTRRGDDGAPFIQVELVRNLQTVDVGKLVRDVSAKDRPESWGGSDDRTDGYQCQPHRTKKGRFVTGQVEYFPMRVAYASTVHKTQSLSLDRIQVDIRNSFFSAFSMVYVALSRARTLDGLRIVGIPELLAARTKCDPKVNRWL